MRPTGGALVMTPTGGPARMKRPRLKALLICGSLNQTRMMHAIARAARVRSVLHHLLLRRARRSGAARGCSTSPSWAGPGASGASATCAGTGCPWTTRGGGQRLRPGRHLLGRGDAPEHPRQEGGGGAGGDDRSGAVLVLGAQAGAHRPALGGGHRLDRHLEPVRPLLRGQPGLPRPVRRARGPTRRASSSPASPTSTTAPATATTPSPTADYVLCCTSDTRETYKPDNRKRFIRRAVDIAAGRPLFFKLHPNENRERSTREIARWAPGARGVHQRLGRGDGGQRQRADLPVLDPGLRGPGPGQGGAQLLRPGRAAAPAAAAGRAAAAQHRRGLPGAAARRPAAGAVPAPGWRGQAAPRSCGGAGRRP